MTKPAHRTDKPPPAKPSTAADDAKPSAQTKTANGETAEPAPDEIGGVAGPDPTRYGDWQHKGRVSDF